jgi:hypothetical protein
MYVNKDKNCVMSEHKSFCHEYCTVCTVLASLHLDDLKGIKTESLYLPTGRGDYYCLGINGSNFCHGYTFNLQPSSLVKPIVTTIRIKKLQQ